MKENRCLPHRRFVLGAASRSLTRTGLCSRWPSTPHRRNPSAAPHAGWLGVRATIAGRQRYVGSPASGQNHLAARPHGFPATGPIRRGG